MAPSTHKDLYDVYSCSCSSCFSHLLQEMPFLLLFFFFGHDTIINYLYVKTHGLCNQACTLCSFVTVQERAAFQSKAGVSICVTFLVTIKAFCLSILLVNLCD